MLTKDDLIREYETRVRRGNLPGLVLMYVAIVGTLLGTAAAIV